MDNKNIIMFSSILVRSLRDSTNSWLDTTIVLESKKMDTTIVLESGK